MPVESSSVVRTSSYLALPEIFSCLSLRPPESEPLVVARSVANCWLVLLRPNLAVPLNVMLLNIPSLERGAANSVTGEKLKLS